LMSGIGRSLAMDSLFSLILTTTFSTSAASKAW